MYKKINLIVTFFISITFIFFIKAEINDSLITKNYKELEEKIHDYAKTKKDRKQYAYTYLKKAKINRDTLNLLNAYYNICFVIDYNKGLQYTDSMLLISKTGYYMNYPEKAYEMKGNLYYNLNNNVEALENYLIAEKIAKKKNNKELLFFLKQSLGNLYNNFNRNKKAKKYLIETTNYHENLYLKNSSSKNRFSYLANLYSLANNYRKSNNYDSAQFLLDKGLKINKNDSTLINLFLLEKNVIKYNLENYTESIAGIKRNLSYLKKRKDTPLSDVMSCYLYLGKNYEKLNRNDSTLFFYNKVDSLLKISTILYHDYLRPYQFLIKYYRNKNVEKELYYTKRLLFLDSVYKNNTLFLTEKVLEEYELPNRLQNKEKQISSLKYSKNKAYFWLCLLLIAITLVIYYFHQRSKNIKLRYEKIIKRLEENKQIIIKKNNTTNSSIDIEQNTVEKIISHLNNFEKNKLYLNKYTLNKLASEFNTNSTYLSKVINHKKGISFSNYINSLRIEYILKRLREDKIFRNYTIKAIAEETGFSSAQSFSRTFKKETGIYPSYFIEKINQNKL
ncbi:hypothetical protein UJ101_01073 [Flavobacteriaceae bacterium UJ101]|nr:hypothetical protein UJ101_01073 [Flavobacteriaceae bacterium UJ101]